MSAHPLDILVCVLVMSMHTAKDEHRLCTTPHDISRSPYYRTICTLCTAIWCPYVATYFYLEAMLLEENGIHWNMAKMVSPIFHMNP